MSAKVYRQITRTEPWPVGEKPPWTEGRWWVHCPQCGHIGTGAGAWKSNPESAQRVADRHNKACHS